MEQLVNTKGAAQILGVRESTVRAWVFQKRLPCVRLGALVRFRPSDLERIQAEGLPESSDN